MRSNVISKRIGDCCEFYFNSTLAPGGYFWIFPKKDRVNIGIYKHRITIPSKDRKNLKQVYNNYIAFLKENRIIPYDLKMGKVRGAALPVSPLEKTYTDRVVLCGDAAGFISPITGEGIYYAMSTGLLAADVVAQALEAEDTSARFLSRYKTMWQHDFGKDIKLLLYASKRRVHNNEKIFKLVMSDDTLSNIIFDIVTGQIGLHEYKWKLIRRYLYINLMDLIGRGK